MPRDIRETEAFRQVERLRVATSQADDDGIGDIADLQPSADGARILFTGTLAEYPDTSGQTRICMLDRATAAVRVLTGGPNSDRHARWSPDGATIAFLSDRDRAADFQLFFFDVATGIVSPAPRVGGWVEYLHWSADGRRILLGVAGHGAELSSGHGAYKTPEIDEGEPSWMPHVSGALPESLWRRIWILDRASGDLTIASDALHNVWEACWCGTDGIAVVVSDDPQEGAWYGAGIATVAFASGVVKHLYAPAAQVALPVASPSGRHLAFVEGIASDRDYVAGDLRILEPASGACRSVPTDAVDVTSIEWCSDDRLLVAGHRGLETVVLDVGITGAAPKAVWASTERTTSGRYATVTALRRPDSSSPGSGGPDFAFVCEGFLHPPRIATVTDGIFGFATAAAPPPGWIAEVGAPEPVHWDAPDGLAIDGWLLRPIGAAPYPTIVEIHGGPVLHWRPYWLARSLATLALLRRGYAIFLPNPRGSSGRGQAFAARVVGDIGGADTGDFLSGIDHLVAAGIADPARLGVTGLSYGGFMSCWLTTQDPRFGAAISVGPATNHVSHHLLCNIPQFVRLFVQDSYTDLAGRYYARSPILHAHQSVTPTMLVAGDLDRCTPAAEAVQFHAALVENGVPSVVVRYPEEGHGVSGVAAGIDFAARCLMWFDAHIPAMATAAGPRVER